MLAEGTNEKKSIINYPEHFKLKEPHDFSDQVMPKADPAARVFASEVLCELEGRSKDSCEVFSD